MTRDEILAMKPGRELDLAIHQKIMGHDMTGFRFMDGNYMYANGAGWDRWEPIPAYSRDVTSAMKVADYFWGYELVCMNGGFEYRFTITNSDDDDTWTAISEKAPEAICKAALIWATCR